MDSKDKLILKKAIESRIAELQHLQTGIETSSRHKSGELMDEATRVDTLSGISVDSALQRKIRQETTALQEQLQRIDSETFGSCEICGEAIPLARLSMVPTARLCITCASLQEQQQ